MTTWIKSESCLKKRAPKNTGNNLESNPVHFSMYVSSFRKRDKHFIELEVDGNHLSLPCEVAEPLDEYCKTSTITLI